MLVQALLQEAALSHRGPCDALYISKPRQYTKYRSLGGIVRFSPG